MMSKNSKNQKTQSVPKEPTEIELLKDIKNYLMVLAALKIAKKDKNISKQSIDSKIKYLSIFGITNSKDLAIILDTTEGTVNTRKYSKDKKNESNKNK